MLGIDIFKNMIAINPIRSRKLPLVRNAEQMSKSNFNQLNKKIFDSIKELHLASGHYAITSSGPLGIRGLRQINDGDLIVDDYLWNILTKKHTPETKNGLTKIVLSEGLVEILGQGSFFNYLDPEDPTVERQIRSAEIIDGLPFVKLKYIRHFKEKLGREKDLEDIKIIDQYLLGKKFE